jgi:hypothetical protein
MGWMDGRLGPPGSLFKSSTKKLEPSKFSSSSTLFNISQSKSLLGSLASSSFLPSSSNSSSVFQNE